MNGDIGKLEERENLSNYYHAYFRSELYSVSIKKIPDHQLGELWRLDIHRNDWQPIMDWRDLQEIKNQICSPAAEAVQLFPAESRVVDFRNDCTLYVVVRTGEVLFPHFAFGCTEGLKLIEPSVFRAGSGIAIYKQRPFPVFGEESNNA